MCGGGGGGGGGGGSAGVDVSCCGFVPRCRGGADCSRSTVQSTTTCTPSCTPSTSQMASSERCCSSISSLGWMCSSSIREAVLSEARADRLGMRMLRAAQRGNLRVVRNLLHMGADANFCTATKWTALHRAAAKGHSSVVSELLANGACVNARNCYGFTPLHTAAYDDYHGRCVQLLVDAGADTGVRNRFGRTALHYAAECGNVAAVKALLRGGASVDARDDAGLTAINLSRTVRVRRMLRACQKKGRRRPSHCARACKPLCPH